MGAIAKPVDAAGILAAGSVVSVDLRGAEVHLKPLGNQKPAGLHAKAMVVDRLGWQYGLLALVGAGVVLAGKVFSLQK